MWSCFDYQVDRQLAFSSFHLFELKSATLLKKSASPPGEGHMTHALRRLNHRIVQRNHMKFKENPCLGFQNLPDVEPSRSFPASCFWILMEGSKPFWNIGACDQACLSSFKVYYETIGTLMFNWAPHSISIWASIDAELGWFNWAGGTNILNKRN